MREIVSCPAPIWVPSIKNIFCISKTLSKSDDFIYNCLMNKKKAAAPVPSGENEAESIPKDFGTRIKKVRKELKLTQSEFAHAIGFSGSFVSDIESGRSKACYDFFLKVAEKFNVNLYYLILGTGNVLGPPRPRADLGDKEVGQPVESLNELLWYIERSPMLRHTVFGFTSKFVYDNHTHILKEIERFDKQKK